VMMFPPNDFYDTDFYDEREENNCCS